MINLVEHIKRQGKDLNKIKKDFLKRIKDKEIKDKNLIDRLEEKKQSLKHSKPLHDLYADIIKNLDELIIGKPSILAAYKNKYKNIIDKEFNENAGNTKDDKEKIIERKKDFLKGLEIVFAYKEIRSEELTKKDLSAKKKKTFVWLLDKLEIKACLYCNAQFIMTAYDKDYDSKALVQFDHFYPKSIYPYLSTSFYNLIPSCSYCNNRKSAKVKDFDVTYHPYYNNLAEKFSFILTKESKAKVFLNKNPDTLILGFKNPTKNKIFEEYKEEINLQGIYDNHKDYAWELLNKSEIYTKEYKDEMLNQINKTISKNAASKVNQITLDELNFMIIGTYFQEEDILKRPLSKFIQDIARDVGLID